jgi:hypothetical protein
MVAGEDDYRGEMGARFERLGAQRSRSFRLTDVAVIVQASIQVAQIEMKTYGARRAV